jgi:cell division protein FtsB
VLASLFLLVALLTAPVIPTETPVIELFPPSKPLAYTKDYMIYLYPDYERSRCPNMADVDVILGPALDMALVIHREAMMRFVGEFGFKYDKLLMLKFEKTGDKKKGMPIYVKDLEPPLAGYFGGRGDYREVVIDCDVAHDSLDTQVSIILHELYHSLGLGHVTTHNDYELMSYSDIPYPSSLDVAGLWELWFGKYASSSVESVNFTIVDIPYAVMEPYNVSLTRLVEQNKEQEGRIRSLMGTVYDLRNDIMTLRDRVTKYEYEVRGLSAENEALRNETARLNMLVGDLSGRLEEREKAVAKLSEELSSASARISSLESQVEKLESLKSSLLAENRRLAENLQALRLVLLVIVAAFFACTAAAMIVSARRRRRNIESYRAVVYDS